ncbi:flagellar biosynthetic protein FliR [Candidatus Sumerlaeota bacterium]|nr:flagellar biosynthetic protein FliR [Candidatus Sumerlaeota bacterium]
MFDIIPFLPLAAAFTLVFFRVALVISMLPLFGEQTTPTTVKVLLAMALSLALVPAADVAWTNLPATVPRLMLALLPEAVFALAIGLTTRILLETSHIAGELVGLQMGFMTASVVDPANNSQISLVSQFWQIATILVFFMINGHHVVILALSRSFDFLPPLSAAFRPDYLEFMNLMTLRMFVVALQLAAPVVVATMLVNICLALVNKVAPNLHVFMESFPLRILLGLAMLVTLSGAIVTILARYIGGLETSLAALLKIAAGQ